MTSPLNGGGKHALGYRRVTTAFAGFNLAKLIKILLQQGEVLVVNLADLTGDMGAAFPVYGITALTSFTGCWHECGLKWDIFNVDLVFTGRSGFFRSALFGSGGGLSAFAFFHGRASSEVLVNLVWTEDAVCDNFGFVLLLTIWSFPRTGLQPARDIYAFTFVQHLVAALTELAPDDYVVEFSGGVNPVAGLVFVAAVGGNGKGGNALVIGRVPHFWVTGQVTNYFDAIEINHESRLLVKAI